MGLGRLLSEEALVKYGEATEPNLEVEEGTGAKSASSLSEMQAFILFGGDSQYKASPKLWLKVAQ